MSITPEIAIKAILPSISDEQALAVYAECVKAGKPQPMTDDIDRAAAQVRTNEMRQR